jgi:hypothetical protein
LENGSTFNELAQREWCLDMSWYEENRCSFFVLGQSSLCTKCRKKIKGNLTSSELLATIKKCCSKTTGFITSDQPILESIFRLFMAGGNQAMTLSQIKDQLEARRGDALSLSFPALARILDKDRYYGIHSVSRS